jgi:uncharacterized protein YbjT (DUF2867 family)
MTPTILVVGATGNTGQSVVHTLSDIVASGTGLEGYRIIALTRSLNNTIAQGFIELPNVSVEEQNWTDITADWLKQRNVVKAFV